MLGALHWFLVCKITCLIAQSSFSVRLYRKLPACWSQCSLNWAPAQNKLFLFTITGCLISMLGAFFTTLAACSQKASLLTTLCASAPRCLFTTLEVCSLHWPHFHHTGCLFTAMNDCSLQRLPVHYNRMSFHHLLGACSLHWVNAHYRIRRKVTSSFSICPPPHLGLS